MRAKRVLWSGRIAAVVVVVLIPAMARAQHNPIPALEVSLRLGLGRLQIFGSDYSDAGPNLGAAVTVRVHRRLGVEFEADRLMNLKPAEVPCGLTVPCTGSAVAGVRSAYHLSGNVLYYLSTSGPVQSYVVGGIGMLQSRTAKAITFGSQTEGRIVQQPDEIDRGVSIGFGGGLRIPVSDRFSVRPEIRLYDATLRSRANLSMVQLATAIGYRW